MSANTTIAPAPSRSVLINSAFLFTACNAVTHGFSMFLYSALLPEIRQHFQLSYTAASLIASLLLLSYMTTSILSGGWIARWQGRAVLVATICLSVPLLILAVSTSWVAVFALALAAVSGCAVANWNAIVAYAGQAIPGQYRSRILGLSSSGAAFAIGLNGLLIAWLLPWVTLAQFWLVCAAITLIVAILTWRGLPAAPAQTVPSAEASVTASSTWTLLKAQPLAWQILLLSAFIGCVSGPLLTFLSSFVVERLGGTSAQTGSLWTMLGVAGMAGGLGMGLLADRFGILPLVQRSLMVLAVCVALMLLRPSLAVVWVTVTLFSALYFPIWGLMASYVSDRIDGHSSVRIISLSMVGYGLGSASANALCGALLDITGSFAVVHNWVLFWVLVNVVWVGFMQRRSQPLVMV